MSWHPLLNAQGAQKQRDGEPIWLCKYERCKLAGPNPRGPCQCERPEQPRLTELDLPCSERTAAVTSVPCGCGRPGERAVIYGCSVLKLCTLQETGIAGLRVEGMRPAVCVGCKSNPDAVDSDGTDGSRDSAD